MQKLTPAQVESVRNTILIFDRGLIETYSQASAEDRSQVDEAKHKIKTLLDRDDPRGNTKTALIMLAVSLLRSEVCGG